MNYAYASQESKIDYCLQSMDNGHFHVFIEKSNKQEEPKTIPAYSPLLILISDCSKYKLSGPLMDKMIIAVNYNSVNNIDIDGSSSGTVRKRLPQVYFTSKTRTVQTHTDLVTNVTIERFTHNLNGEHAAKFSKIIDICLSGYGRLERDSNTLCKTYYGKEIYFIKKILFSGFFFLSLFQSLIFFIPPRIF